MQAESTKWSFSYNQQQEKKNRNDLDYIYFERKIVEMCFLLKDGMHESITCPFIAFGEINPHNKIWWFHTSLGKGVSNLSWNNKQSFR
jgi:hypothetical protein